MAVEPGPEPAEENTMDVEPGPDAVDITEKKDGGVLKETLKEGGGNEHPLQGDRVFVHYVGTLAEDGSKFDSSRDRNEQFEFTLGKGEVIKAWDLGVATMKKGEIAKFTCRSEYAYGERGSPPKIPPNATLIFEVELFEWRGEDLSSKKDGGIIRRIMAEGEGYQTPNDGAIVDVHVVGKVNGTSFDDREVQFPLGEGTEHNIPEGLERALERFKKGEKSTIKLAPKYAFGSAGNPDLNVPPGASLEYEVELRSFEKAKESWEMDQEEKIEQAKVCKERGTTFFKQNKYRLAVKQYKKIIDLLQYDSGLDDEKKAESHSVLLAGHLNLAMAYLKLNDNSHAREHATKALELDSTSVKGYFRRGQAYLNMGDAEQGQLDFQACLKLDESNKAAKHQLQLCAAKIKADKLKEKKLYGGMFEKFARMDKAKEEAEYNRYKDVMAGDLGEWGNSEEKSDSGKSEKKENFTNASDDPSRNALSGLGDIEGVQML
ncbi:peptidyl-prolyl cis-trans isomerase FKBP4 isoform X1 [Penaeus vannamei]|uniref:peptidylprolyl isomerase n=2 Tax=Penaeus vannamei TaxID=6689 RepID=A0A423SSG0_PENVA|nr:peptidyl-prolyl cis-trans isomerase FKBP4-like isoform X1 [Penaeus vannamei]XP_027225814.1 peptidyl-prolyl cis-trans isomerase FKBP4-like isoform X1 [Penaeus vannamei]XP_027225815.1 peptidyl-prolyl cis-trans isomerase FKBP4-like isoform X1 [Penaeus vannamei]ROT67118.1 FK506-binding protein 4 [Penaeus vannamei]